MTAVREFQLKPADDKFNRRVINLLDPVFHEPFYRIDNDISGPTATVHDSKGQELLGSVMALTLNGETSFTNGDPNLNNSATVRLRNNARMTRMNHFSFDVKTPLDGQQTLRWKHTKDVRPTLLRGDVVNMKLVHESTGHLVARFVHAPATPHVMVGTFEMHEDRGPGWHLTLFLSCLAVLKYGSLMMRFKAT